MADVILPLLTSLLAIAGIAAALGACVHAYRHHPARDPEVRLWTPSGLSVAVTATLAGYADLEHRSVTTHLLAAAQVALATACAVQWRAEGSPFHLALAAFLAATTTTLVTYDALVPRRTTAPTR